MVFNRLHQRLWQHSHPVFAALAVADRDLAVIEVDIFCPQSQTFHQAYPGPIEEAGHEPTCSLKLTKNRPDFLAGEHDGQACGFLGALDTVNPVQFLMKDVLVEE